MKLAELAEALITRGDLRRTAQQSATAARGADLSSQAQAVWAAKTIEDKKAAAREMAQFFKLGGVPEFLASVDKCVTPMQVDKLAANALLKGEGKGTKLY